MKTWGQQINKPQSPSPINFDIHRYIFLFLNWLDVDFLLEAEIIIIDKHIQAYHYNSATDFFFLHKCP